MKCAPLLFLLAPIVVCAAPQRFAEDLPAETGEAVVFRLSIDEAGLVGTCTLQGVHEATPQGVAVDTEPTQRYLADACRKLSQRHWKIERDAQGGIKPVYYFCRRQESAPDYAYCERRFGD